MVATRQRTAAAAVAASSSSTTTLVVEKQPVVKVEATAELDYPDIKSIKDAIPAHCFQPSLITSYYYVVRDLTMVAGLVWAALTYIPAIPDPLLRGTAWMVYGFLQGLICTGVWILGHECGHNAFSLHGRVNSVTGWALHSFLLVPFFSWKFSHHRHHLYHGHIEKDMAFVPATAPKASKQTIVAGIDIAELFEDTPISQVLRLIFHQLFGWQAYLLFNATSGKGSRQRQVSGISKWLRVSHFEPTSAVFRPNEAIYIFLSDVGLAIMGTVLYFTAQKIGASTTFLLYGVPYIWVHHWLVAITYLHHNHPEVPHFTPEGWTYVKGALATIDRDFGFIGKHLFHGIIEKHVIHHLFPRIPFYKADEATEAVMPIIGKHYVRDDRNFIGQLWSVFGSLKYVEHDPTIPGNLRWAK